MVGVLHVLQHASPDAPRLHSQNISFQEPPQRGRRFAMRTGGTTSEWKTSSVELDPQRVNDNSVWFRTTQGVSYLLEQVPL